MSDADATITDAIRYIRSRSTGELVFEGHITPTGYVVGPDGRLVAPLMYAAASTVDLLLVIPDYAEPLMHVMITPVELDRVADGALMDRWQAYHGEPQDTHWTHLDIDAVKFAADVIDGDAFKPVNAIAEHESVCRKALNERRDEIRGLCARTRDIELERPVIVGVDQFGFDVRGQFSVLRFEFPAPVGGPGDVDAALDALLSADA